MKNERIRSTIRILGAAAILLALILGWLIWAYISATKPKSEEAKWINPQAEQNDAADETKSAPELTPAPLIRAVDLKPDTEKLFLTYDATLYDVDGNGVSLAEMRGKPLALFFWSSWCDDCDRLFAGWLDEAKKAAEEGGARFYIVCREGVKGETAGSAVEYLAQKEWKYETLMDEDAALFKELGLRSVPTLAFFSPQGKLMNATDEMPSAESITQRVIYSCGGAAKQSAEFVSDNIMTSAGAVVSSYSFDPFDNFSLLDSVLSESQGLMMEYAAQADDKELFDKVYAYCRDAMTKGGMCAWRVTNGGAANTNATLDDLRIIGALMDARDKWGGYDEDIDSRESALYKACVAGDELRDYVNFTSGARSDETTLCYLDIAILEKLSAYRPRWQPVAESSKKLLQDGLVSEDFPLYYPRYDAASGVYSGDRLQMNEAMVTVLHAVRAGVVSEKTLDYLQSLLDSGPVYASYLYTGQPAAGYEYESTATYAILAMIGFESGREEMAYDALRHMESERNFSKALSGSYGLETDTPHFAFDTLNAMLAWSRAV